MITAYSFLLQTVQNILRNRLENAGVIVDTNDAFFSGPRCSCSPVALMCAGFLCHLVIIERLCSGYTVRIRSVYATILVMSVTQTLKNLVSETNASFLP